MDLDHGVVSHAARQVRQALERSSKDLEWYLLDHANWSGKEPVALMNMTGHGQGHGHVHGRQWLTIRPSKLGRMIRHCLPDRML